MKKTKNEFKEQYAKCRERSSMTYRALEKATGIKHSALVAMQTGSRACGEQSARRIASAFGLTAAALESFVLTALNTSKEKVLAAVSGYPSEVLNFLGLFLTAQGIEPAKIIRCEFDVLTPNRLTLILPRGKAVQVQVTLSDGRLGKRLHDHG